MKHSMYEVVKYPYICALIFSLDLEFQAKVSGSCYLVALLDALGKDIKEPREGASSTYIT